MGESYVKYQVRTALLIAVGREVRGQARHLARTLLAAGADPNHRDPRGATPLIQALATRPRSRHAARLVADLLRAGADSFARDGRGRTPLAIALKSYQAEAAALLRAAGATGHPASPHHPRCPCPCPPPCPADGAGGSASASAA